MKDSLKDLFRERFQGHEAPVDPATWQVIEARMLTSPPAADNVNELFRERFQQHEVNVDPGVWQGISSQLGHGAAAGGGLFGGFGWVAAGIAGVVVVGALVLALNSTEETGLVAQEKADAVAPVVPMEPLAEPVGGSAVQVSETVNNSGRIALVAERPAPSITAVSGTSAAVPSNTSGNDMAPLVPQEPLPATNANPVPDPEGARLVNTIISDLSEGVEEQVRASYRQASSSDPKEPVTPSVEPPAETDPAPMTHGELQKPFMPSVFTPNNDGINDAYIVPMEGYTSLLLRVYSMKSNQLVFSTNSGEPWTGANCEDGMYLVAVEAMTADGRLVSEGKVVWLNRTGMN